jgi:hypothetical protein
MASRKKVLKRTRQEPATPLGSGVGQRQREKSSALSQADPVETLPLAAVDALHAYVFKHLFGLLLFSDGRVEVGSGVGIKVGSRFFVATAGHNLCGLADESIALVHLDRPSLERFPFQTRWPPSSARDPQPDIGFLELPALVALQSDKRFLALDEIQPGFSHQAGNVLLVGYPAESVPRKLVERGIFRLEAMAFTTSTVEPYGHALDPTLDIALEYRDSALVARDRSRMVTPKPHGLSGAGVWSFPPPRESGVWSPSDSRLLGIQRSWCQRSHIVLCTQIQHWLRLIAEKCPDLASAIADAQHGNASDGSCT